MNFKNELEGRKVVVIGGTAGMGLAVGLVRDTDAYNDVPVEAREKMFTQIAESVPSKRVGQTQDIASAALAIMTNPFIKGSVVDVDGGAIVR